MTCRLSRYNKHYNTFHKEQLLTETVNVENLKIVYDPTVEPAVKEISFTVKSGEVLGLLGGNGAGKTSTLRVLAGIQPANSGIITIDNINVNTSEGVEQARQIVGYCPDTAGLIRQATVREHIALALAFHNKTDLWPSALDLVEKFGLTEVLDKETMGFSHGMSRRLSVLLAALTAEKVLILDEPFDGVDPLGVKATEVIIKHAKEKGLAVIISTHLLSLLTGVSDRIIVMVKGEIVDQAPAKEFKGVKGTKRYTDKLLGV